MSVDYFCSIAQSPGKTGEYFYGRFFEYYKVAAQYEAIGVLELDAWVDSKAWKKFSGISVSMPFKPQVLKYLHSMEEGVIDFAACNTIKVEEGYWRGFNTDVYGIEASCRAIPLGCSIQILGDGAMSRGYQIILRGMGLDCRINTTSYGTTSIESPLFAQFNASLVIDLAIAPGMLSDQCKSLGIQYVGGMCFYELVFSRQFLVYTGIEVDPELFRYFLSKR